MINLFYLLQLIGSKSIIQRVLCPYQITPRFKCSVYIPLTLLGACFMADQIAKCRDITFQYNRSNFIH